MKNCRSLFDLCMVREGARNEKTVKITAMSYLRPCDDKEQRMEDLLLQTSEYIVLRGKGDGSWPGLLREVSIVPARRACPRFLFAPSVWRLMPACPPTARSS